MSLSLRDDLGRTITLPAVARRIVSLSPAATENLFAVGAGARVIAVTAADTYPAAVSKLPRAGDFGTPRYETIRALKPDLIVAESGTLGAGEVQHIAERARVPVFAQVSRTYDDVARHLRQFALLTGNERGAAQQIALLQKAAAEAKRRVAGKKPVSAFIEVSRSPLYGAGPGSFLDDVLRKAGGVNVLHTHEPYPMVSREALVVANPQAYIVTVPGATERVTPVTEALPAPLDRLAAAQAGRVIALPIDLLFRPTPRLARGLLLMVQALHR